MITEQGINFWHELYELCEIHGHRSWPVRDKLQEAISTLPWDDWYYVLDSFTTHVQIAGSE